MTPLIVPRRIAKNAVSQVGVYALATLQNAVALVLVARALGPKGLGVFSPVWTVAGMLALFSVLGLDYFLVRELSRDNSTDRVATALPLACVLGVTIGGLLFGVPTLIGVPHTVQLALIPAACYVALTSPLLVFKSGFHAMERMELETAAVAVEGVVGLLALVFVITTGPSIVGAIAALTCGRLANLITTIIVYRRICGMPQMRLVPKAWPRMVAASIPMGASYIFTTLLLRFDIVLLSLMRSSKEVGIYAAAAALPLTLPQAASGLGRALYPVFSRAKTLHDPELVQLFSRVWRGLLLTAIAAAAGICVLARPIILLIYGHKFTAAIPALAVIAWVLPVRFVNTLLGVVLNATDRQGRRAVAVAVGAGFNIGLNLMLIPMFGWWGAVWSTLTTEFALTAVLLWGIRPLRPPLLVPLLQGGGVAIGTAALAVFVPGDIFVKIAAGGLVLPLSVLVAWRRTRRTEEPAVSVPNVAA